MIREGKESDLEQLAEIELEAFPQSPWLPTDFLRYQCLVATQDDHLQGFLVSREIAPEAAGQPAEHEILNLAVRSDCRRSGIATSLIRYEMQKPGIFFLEVRASNIAGKALYKKLGFRELGYRFDYYENPRETAIVMTTRPV